jgi:threonine aldolase
MERTVRVLDFRSDTVTRPTPAMRQAMAEAAVGDDVFGDDPTVNRLQEQVAALLGKEAALFVPSGTMSNVIGVRLHCRPGDELICEANSHVYLYEQGGYAQLNGTAVRPVTGSYGILTLPQVEQLICPDDQHFPQTRLLCLENTHNRGGGRVQPYATLVELCRWAHERGLKTHLDGARLMNAVVASGIPAAQWAEHFDSVGLCFSKGLGAPVGSAIAGTREQMALARRHRKLLGGGMRQAGILAAAALYALEHHVARLAEDHANARRLADGIRRIGRLGLDPEAIDTNIVYFQVDPGCGTAAEFCAALERRGLWLHDMGPQTARAVTHLDVDRDDVDRAIEILAETAGQGIMSQSAVSR